ncbi:MAG: MFS transporter [Inquilinus sp.]|nr:MFS transporter [Inquilinus sp.]
MTAPQIQDIGRAAQGADPTRRNVLLLALCQALGISGMSIIVTISALVGYSLATDKTLATLPLALQFTATMASTVPASMLMGRIGRRAGFSVGTLFGIGGGAVAAYAVFEASFVLFIVGSMLIGTYQSFVQYYRFAAADTASERFRPRAISLVLAGGVIAAVVGPELAKWSRELFLPIYFAGCYVVIIALATTALVLLQFIEIPRLTAEQRRTTGRPALAILRQPKTIAAILSAATAYAVMSLVMTATPLAMVACGFAFNDAAFVIQWHSLAMFAPSFFTGSLVQRFGAVNIILTGAVLNVACLAINLSGVEFIQFWSALVLLGLGWNFMFVGGTTLLTEVHSPAERAKTQAMNDFIVFTGVAVAAFSSGALHTHLGWAAVNVAMAVPLTVALAAVLRLKFSPPAAAA